MATEFFSVMTKNGKGKVLLVCVLRFVIMCCFFLGFFFCCCCFVSLLLLLFLEYVDTLISLNKQDILLANERFGHRRKKPVGVLTSHDSFKGLTEEQKKVRKAQQFGVKMVFDVQMPANQVNDRENEEQNGGLSIVYSNAESLDTNSIADLHLSPPLVPPTLDITTISSQVPPLSPTPIPRVRKRRQVTGSAFTLPRRERISAPIPTPRSAHRHSANNLNGDEWRPVPTPRQRNRSETTIYPVPIPRPRSRKSAEIVSMAPNERPIPKPRKLKMSPTDSNYQEAPPRSSLEIPVMDTPSANLHTSPNTYSDEIPMSNKTDSNTVSNFVIDAGSLESTEETLKLNDDTRYPLENSSPPQQPATFSNDSHHTPSLAHKTFGNQLNEAGSAEALDEPSMGGNLEKLRIRANTISTSTARDKQEEGFMRGTRAMSLGSHVRHNPALPPPMVSTLV